MSRGFRTVSFISGMTKGTVPKRLDICYNFGIFNNIHSLTDRLTDRPTDWPTDWLSEWLTVGGIIIHTWFFVAGQNTVLSMLLHIKLTWWGSILLYIQRSDNISCCLQCTLFIYFKMICTPTNTEKQKRDSKDTTYRLTKEGMHNAISVAKTSVTTCPKVWRRQMMMKPVFQSRPWTGVCLCHKTQKLRDGHTQLPCYVTVTQLPYCVTEKELELDKCETN